MTNSGVKTPQERATPTIGSPVYAFLEKPSMMDYPGHLCGVFFTSGCNFSCGFCHNASLMETQPATISWKRLEEVCGKFKREWVDGVCISGGEPTLAKDLIQLIDFFKSYGFKVKLDSNGARPEVLKECLTRIDYIAMDIKAGLSGYPEIAGYSDTDKIKESIQLIMQSGIDHEFRTTVIDPFHSDEQMLEAGRLIQGAKRYVMQAFIPHDHLPDEVFRTTLRTTPDRLRALEKMMAPFADEIIVRGA